MTLKILNINNFLAYELVFIITIGIINIVLVMINPNEPFDFKLTLILFLIYQIYLLHMILIELLEKLKLRKLK